MTHADFQGYIASKGKSEAKQYLQQTFNMSAGSFKAQTRKKRRKVVTTEDKSLLEAHVNPVREWLAEERNNPKGVRFSSESWNRMSNDIEVVFARFQRWAKTTSHSVGHITKLNFRKMVEYIETKVEHHFVEGAGAYSKNKKGNIPLQIGSKKRQQRLDKYFSAV